MVTGSILAFFLKRRVLVVTINVVHFVSAASEHEFDSDVVDISTAFVLTADVWLCLLGEYVPVDHAASAAHLFNEHLLSQHLFLLLPHLLSG